MKQLQVVFDKENTHRRKSSLVTADTPQRLLQRHKSTTCFVHSLLESQRKRGEYQGSLDGITETLNSKQGRQVVMAVDAAPGMDEIGDPKGGNSNGRSVRKAHFAEEDGKKDGQPDELAWRDNRKQPPEEEDPSTTHSRLLTKKQLSDMAWGVRELSKRLGSIRLKLKVKTVFILTKAHDETLIKNTREVVRWLLSEERQVRYTVYVEENLKDNKKFDAKGILQELEEPQRKEGSAMTNGDASTGKVDGKGERRLRYWTNDMCRTRPHTFDFVVTLGGDGTVLYASWLFQRIVPPVLSFALGSLGFLTKFDYENFQDTLTKAFRDGVLVSLRLRFEGTVMRSQGKKTKKRSKSKSKHLTDGEKSEDSPSHSSKSSDDERPRDLVEELIGEETDDEWTHKPDGTYEILNDIVVDRGPNPSKCLPTELLSYDRSLTNNPSHVINRDLRRRRTFHLRPSRRRLRLDPNRIHSLQPRSRRIPLPPREPSDPRKCDLCPHPLLPTHHPPRHYRPAHRCAIRRPNELMGEL
jgi:NAD+ kinase